MVLDAENARRAQECLPTGEGVILPPRHGMAFPSSMRLRNEIDHPAPQFCHFAALVEHGHGWTIFPSHISPLNSQLLVL